MLSQFWPICGESRWLIFKKNESVWPRKIEPYWLKFNYDSVVESSWLEKLALFLVTQFPSQLTQKRSNLSQSDWVLCDGLINWLFESTWLNNWVMVAVESIRLSFSGSNWLIFLQNESKWFDVFESKLGQHDSIFKSLWLGKNSQCLERNNRVRNKTTTLLMEQNTLYL